MATRPQLDHVIILLPYADVLHPPAWLTKHFTISPGGRHADGKTENRLILFQDGTYAELIAFINDDPEKRKGHWWDKPFGIVDYALTDPGTEPDVAAINARLANAETQFSYEDPKSGARHRPDGVELKWKVTFPQGIERGVIPFWCHDVTPRENRVPLTAESTRHPCGALGMAGVQIEVDASRSDLIKTALAAVIDEKPSRDGKFLLDAPAKIEPSIKPTLRITPTSKASDTTKLILVILTGGNEPDRIEQQVESGSVNIHFEASP